MPPAAGCFEIPRPEASAMTATSCGFRRSRPGCSAEYTGGGPHRSLAPPRCSERLWEAASGSMMCFE